MDRNSDRYRICPNDGVEFMANDRREIYCSEECCNEFHNLKKRNKKNSSNNRTVEFPSTKHPFLINQKDININILSQLTFENTQVVIGIEELIQMGYDFNTYESIEELQPVIEECKSRFLKIGKFNIYRIEIDKLLIQKTK
jgi:hypothetical protein